MALQGTIDIGYDKQAWDMLTYFAFRDEMIYDAWASVKPTRQSTEGSTVTFTKTDDLAVADTPLSEKSDITPVNFSDSNVSVTLAEYGNAVETTRFLRETSFIPLDPVVANVIGYNAGLSQDTVARTELHSGTNSRDKGQGSTLTASDVRRERAALRGANVPTLSGGFYGSSIHPDVSVDLREETGAAAWRDPQVYGQSQLKVWNGEIGIFEGVRFIETPRAVTNADAYDDGAGGLDDSYETLFVGAQALAKAFARGVGPTPVTVPGPVTDTLKRFVPMGWYWLGGYSIFRNESIRKVVSDSTLQGST